MAEDKQTRKEVYEAEYAASKEGGESFYPYTLVKDAAVALLLVGGIIALAALIPPSLEPPADPTSTTYNPRPEWYFLFFFQFLKLFPGSLEALAAVIIPLVLLILLAIIPFLDRKSERRWSRRRPMITVGIVVILLFAALEVTGATSAPGRPAGEESHLVQTGRQVYQETNCAYCHSIAGVGGNIGPDLSGIGGILDASQLEAYLQDPNSMVVGTLHPKLLFTDEELAALVAYLETLGAPITYSAEAPKLFQQNCVACHMIEGKGGTLGPDLSSVGVHRSVNFLIAYTTDPDTVLPGASMPAFKDRLTADEIKDIAAYLANQRGTAAETSP